MAATNGGVCHMVRGIRNTEHSGLAVRAEKKVKRGLEFCLHSSVGKPTAESLTNSGGICHLEP